MPRKFDRAKSRAREKEEVRSIIQEDLHDGSDLVMRKPISAKFTINQLKWTDKQKELFSICLDPDTRIVFINGPAGTSKTMAAIYCGLQLLNMKWCTDLMYLRSAVESSQSKLGFLPGDADEKLAFYNMPFSDKLDRMLTDTGQKKLRAEKRISTFPVNYARGMDWPNKCIILDEAQNSAYEEITTVLTRINTGSRAFILADPMQTDLRNGSRGGFMKMYNHFGDNEKALEHGIRTFEFTEEDVMRDPMLKYLIPELKNLKEF
tara:strand:+ start:441 stop:1229 length:789 start_codon:yes stop_codon:yes gene_type:complete